MNTLKSTAVILVLALVLYGVYAALNKPEMTPPAGMTTKDIDEMGPPEVDFSGEAGPTSHLPAPPTTLSPPVSESPAAELPTSSGPKADTQASIYAPSSTSPRRRQARQSRSTAVMARSTFSACTVGSAGAPPAPEIRPASARSAG